MTGVRSAALLRTVASWSIFGMAYHIVEEPSDRVNGVFLGPKGLDGTALCQ
jgi:hypothetical protein